MKCPSRSYATGRKCPGRMEWGVTLDAGDLGRWICPKCGHFIIVDKKQSTFEP
jgi:hypothetical protein